MLRWPQVQSWRHGRKLRGTDSRYHSTGMPTAEMSWLRFRPGLCQAAATRQSFSHCDRSWSSRLATKSAEVSSRLPGSESLLHRSSLPARHPYKGIHTAFRRRLLLKGQHFERCYCACLFARFAPLLIETVDFRLGFMVSTRCVRCRLPQIQRKGRMRESSERVKRCNLGRWFILACFCVCNHARMLFKISSFPSSRSSF